MTSSSKNFTQNSPPTRCVTQARSCAAQLLHHGRSLYREKPSSTPRPRVFSRVKSPFAKSSCAATLAVKVLDVRVDFDDVCASNAHTVNVAWKVDGACGDYVAEVAATYFSGENQIVPERVGP